MVAALFSPAGKANLRLPADTQRKRSQVLIVKKYLSGVKEPQCRYRMRSQARQPAARQEIVGRLMVGDEFLAN